MEKEKQKKSISTSVLLTAIVLALFASLFAITLLGPAENDLQELKKELGIK